MISYEMVALIQKKQVEEGRRITVQEISLATGINRTTLSRMIHHKGHDCLVSNIEALCKYFSCEPSELIKFEKGDSVPTARSLCSNASRPRLESLTASM